MSQFDGKPAVEGEGLRVYTIPPTRPFLPTLVEAILKGVFSKGGVPLADPLALSRMTLLFPSRRACRAAELEFLRQSDGAVLLPEIRAVGDIDEQRLLTAGVIEPLPPAISDLERQLVLTEMVRKWSDTLHQAARNATAPDVVIPPQMTPAQAAALAVELMELMDTAEIEQADLSKLASLVREDFAQHWQVTLDFLEIVTAAWPAFLDSAGKMSRVARQTRLIEGEAARLAQRREDDPVILAGEIGGVAATAKLMRAIVNTPGGAIVLPGLDLELDEASFNTIVPSHPEHPQYGLKQLLDELAIDRRQVIPLGEVSKPWERAKLKLLSEMMRPAATTHLWAGFAQAVDREALAETLRKITVITTRHEEEEAEAIALILRRAAADATRTAALVTPDRTLARRVKVRLGKWGVGIDDSGGLPLATSPIGTFLDHVIETINSGFDPAALLTLLKHPLTRLGFAPGEVRAATRALEIAVLREPRVEPGLAAIRKQFDYAAQRFADGKARQAHHQADEGEADAGSSYQNPAQRRLRQADFARTGAVLEALADAFEPLEAYFQAHRPRPLKELVSAHRVTAERLARFEDGHSEHLWGDDFGMVMAALLDQLVEEDIASPLVSPQEYAGLYRGLIAREVVRSGRQTHDRLFIWGPMEARLQTADIVILGGLNEGVWPQAADTDAWLSRPMRAELGLSQPERKIGRSAHDFCQAFGAEQIYLSRAEKMEGVPTVPSRWLLRLQALADSAGLGQALAPGSDEPWLDWVALRDAAPPVAAAKRPHPVPPVAARPRKLSVSRVEDWITNPYALFARMILQLEPLPELGMGPDAALRGQIIHQALHRFSTAFPDHLPDNIAQELLAFAEKRWQVYADHPQVLAFWKPRFARFAQWFEATEPERRVGLLKHLSEVEGQIEFPAPAGPFTLTARADRLDVTAGGAVVIYDYKTGTPPTAKEIKTLRKPQLPLEAKIAKQGGFAGLEAVPVAGLSFIKASGDEDLGAQEDRNEPPPDGLAETAFEGLVALVSQFDQPETGYPALRRPYFDYRYDDYAHLARLQEWAVDEEGEA